MASIVSAGTTSSTALNMSADTSGVLQLASNNGTTAVTIGTDQSVTFAGSINAPNSFGFKNRIINGAMVINQRATAVTATAFTVDRFEYVASQSSKATISQDTSVYPTGFNASLKALSSSAYTVGASEVFMVRQSIEGFNSADLGWGTANAKTVTLSFWVYSSLTGTFGGAIENSDGNRCYVYSYSIPVANTWTQITATIAGDTTGTWVGATNGIGLRIAFTIGAGSTVSGAAGSWGSTRYFSVTGATSVVGTNGATFYITGVQLEKGSTATSFDYRPYGTELALCQRYLPAFTTLSGGDGGAIGMGVYYDTTHTASYIPFSVITRVAPTGVTVTNASSFANDGVNSATVTAIAISSTSQYGSGVNVTVGSAQTSGQGARLRFNGTGAQLLFTGCEL
jgi:hypothetical protein